MEKTMILRGVSEQVHKSAKIAAAELGISLQEFCIRALRLACTKKEWIAGMDDNKAQREWAAGNM